MSDTSKKPAALKSMGGTVLVAALYFIVNGITLKEGAGIMGESVLTELLGNVNIGDQVGNIGTGIAGLLLGGGMLRQGFKRGREE